ncbi:MAG: histidine phosphatase family protein, partial [Saprospiraceae bacterium]
IFLFATLSISLLESCTKDPEIITNTIYEIDTITIIEHDTITIQFTDTINIMSYIQDTVTTYLLIRHAEKESFGSDPELNAIGKERAIKLANNLMNTPLAAIYSTDYKRTTQTVLPTAEQHGIDIEIYNPNGLIALKNKVTNNNHGEIVMVVGHSNTTPNLLNLLTESNSYMTLPESEYDNFYIVSVSNSNQAKVLHFKY